MPALEGSDLWMGTIKGLQHGLGAQAIGQARSYQGASAGPHIDVQIIDGAVNQQIVNGSQGPISYTEPVRPPPASTKAILLCAALMIPFPSAPKLRGSGKTIPVSGRIWGRDIPAHQPQQTIQGKRLVQIMPDGGMRSHSKSRCAIGANHDDGGARVYDPNRLGELQPIHVWQ